MRGHALLIILKQNDAGWTVILKGAKMAQPLAVRKRHWSKALRPGLRRNVGYLLAAKFADHKFAIRNAALYPYRHPVTGNVVFPLRQRFLGFPQQEVRKIRNICWCCREFEKPC